MYQVLTMFQTYMVFQILYIMPLHLPKKALWLINSQPHFEYEKTEARTSQVFHERTNK